MAQHARQLNGSTVNLLESSKAGSASVTPSVILHKEGMLWVPAVEKPNLDIGIAVGINGLLIWE